MTEAQPAVFLEARNNSPIYFTQAREYLQAAKQSDDEAMNYIRESIKQSCTGLIQTFMQYYCGNLSLSQLISLCINFTTLTEEYFPRHTSEEIRLFNLLLNDPSQNSIRLKDIEQLLGQAELFLKEAESLCVLRFNG